MSDVATRERPILFSGPMVRAILDGRKVQTRRIVKPQPVPAERSALFDVERIRWGDVCEGLPEMVAVLMESRSPYKPGMHLWVRETWSEIPEARPSGYFTDPKWIGRRTWYAADNDKPTWGGKWRPSIFMPRWASRITLEITGVRVERLQDITRLDCVEEGWPHDDDPAHHPLQIQQARAGLDDAVIDDAAWCWYAELWDKINGPGSWDSNPWVWVVSFRRIDQ